MSHELSAEQRGRIIDQQTEDLRAARYAAELRIACLEGIPEELRDGSEEDGIETLRKRIQVVDSQLETIAAQFAPEPRNREQRRAKNKAGAGLKAQMAEQATKDARQAFVDGQIDADEMQARIAAAKGTRKKPAGQNGAGTPADALPT